MQRHAGRHMTLPLISQIERLPAGRLAGFCCDEGNCAPCLRAYHEGRAFMRQEHAARVPHKPRKPTLVIVAKQASKAGIPVARNEVQPDGTVVVVTGESEPAKPEN